MQSGYSESKVLIEIETFIDNVLNGSVLNLRAIDFFQKINQLQFGLNVIFKSDYMYATKVNVFIKANNCCLSKYQGQQNKIVKEYFCHIVFSFEDDIASEIYCNQTQEHKNKTSLIHYVDNLTKHYSRLLFVRVDLSYLLYQQQLVTIQDMHDDFAKLLKKMANKRNCFHHLQGYAWALEQGKDKGYHCHLLLMFDGAKHQNDWYLGRRVGELWLKITGTKGSYFSCNDSKYKDQYKKIGKLGIGMIHRSNSDEVKNALDTASYLVNPEKAEQFLRVKINKGMRTFGKGVFQTKKRRGIKMQS